MPIFSLQDCGGEPDMTKNNAEGRSWLTRREVLGYGAAGMAALAMPGMAAESNVQRNLHSFMKVSSALTGKTSLNAITNERIFLAMGGNSRELLGPLERLAGKVGQPPSTWAEEDRALAADIVRAWYLGKVGDGPEAEVITYEHSLMYEAVSGALEPRTFCASQPGYWANKPA